MSEPAGFWRRSFAALIDLAISVLVLSCLAPVLFAATDGRWQYVPDVNLSTCQSLNSLPEGLTFSPGFAPNYASLCEFYFAGWPAARILTVGQQTVGDNLTTNVSYTLAVDAEGTIIGMARKSPSIELFVVLRLLCDVLARTPGRRICGIAVVDRATGERARRSRLLGRYLLFALPLAPAFLAAIVVQQAVASATWSGLTIATLVASLSIIAGLWVWTIVSIVRRRPAYYDRFAGTSVDRR